MQIKKHSKMIKRIEEMKKKMENKKNYNTRYAKAVSHPSPDRARRCLTPAFRREPVHSTWYGRRRWLE